jgi:hypothetical protein
MSREIFPVKPGDRRPVWLIPVSGVVLRFRWPLSVAFRKSKPLWECPVEQIDLAARARPTMPLMPDPYRLEED